MRYLLLGIFLSAISALISWFLWGNEKAHFITGIIGIIFIVISMKFSGTMVSGDRMRANLATESVEDRHNRNSVTFSTALIAIPNLVIALLIYFFLN